MVFHGINDSCEGQKGFVQVLQEGMPSNYVKCIETGADTGSVVGASIRSMAELGCKLVQADQMFYNKRINVVG